MKKARCYPLNRIFPKYSCADSEIFIGRKKQIKRYLICSMQGHFPVLVKTGPDSLATIFRTGAPHIGLSATVAISTSEDGGISWSDPVEITPRWEDSRNPALGTNKKGELIAAFYKASLNNYYESSHGYGMRYIIFGNKDFESLRDRENVPALFFTKSVDNGRNWTEPRVYESELLSLANPFGRIIITPDNTLLMPAYGYPREKTASVAEISILLRSTDGGETWGDETLTASGGSETSYAILPDGTLMAAARFEDHRELGMDYTAVLFSKDMGRTWSEPTRVTCNGEYPADITVLQSGKVLLTFGRRRRPFGCGALLSNDNGVSWDNANEIILAGDGESGGIFLLGDNPLEMADLGYPSTVQLDNGNIVTAMYYSEGSGMAKFNPWEGWGRVSCQALHYGEDDIV